MVKKTNTITEESYEQSCTLTLQDGKLKNRRETQYHSKK